MCIRFIKNEISNSIDFAEKPIKNFLKKKVKKISISKIFKAS